MPAEGSFVKLNQCVFGYEDGHRLLSASLRLAEEAASLLLLHSDLVPGLDTTRNDGYWTGIPVPSLKAYALMRTWPAPEMPRPGCVWTHVVLIAFADMARLPDLAVLRSLFVRPHLSGNYSAYANPLVLDPLSVAEPALKLISQPRSLYLLRTLYEPPFQGLLMERGEQADVEIFAIWSQQWPRLRRTFSFRTAGLALEPSLKTRFDLRVVSASPSFVTVTVGDATPVATEWESTAIEDLHTAEPSRFRRFLWRYGSDIRRGRYRYRFLAEVFRITGARVLTGSAVANILDTVVNALPDADDGNLLKQDILSCGRSVYSLFPAADPIDILRYCVDHADLKALPPPPDVAIQAISDLWPTRSSEILSIAERAVVNRSGIGVKLVHQLSAVVEPESFLALSRGHPVIRDVMIRANPALLNSPDLISLAPKELSDALALLPDDDELVRQIIDRLIFSDNRDVAVLFTERFLNLTEDRVFDALVAELSPSDMRVPRVWPDTVRQRSQGLATRMLKRAVTTTALAALAGWLGLDVAAGLDATSAAWAATLVRVKDDIQGQPRQRLLAYLLALALAHPCPGCEPLFEMAFESVHADIEHSRLPYDAFDALARFLPDLYWWQQWDTCLRLRVAVVHAYVDSNLDLQSFLRLTSDPILLQSLVDVASEKKAGRRFLGRI